MVLVTLTNNEVLVALVPKPQNVIVQAESGLPQGLGFGGSGGGPVGPGVFDQFIFSPQAACMQLRPDSHTPSEDIGKHLGFYIT